MSEVRMIGIGRSGMVYFAPRVAGWFARYKDVETGPYPTQAAAEEALAEMEFAYEPPPLAPPADPMLDQIEHWFTYQTPTPAQVADMALLREMAKGLAHQIVRVCPPSADRSAAIRLLRESIMTANASIVLGGK